MCVPLCLGGITKQRLHKPNQLLVDKLAMLNILTMSYSKLSDDEEAIGKYIVNACFKVHTELGPGLLEKVYEVCVAHELRKAGLAVARQIDIPIQYDGLTFEEGLRLDLLVENKVIVEIKAVDQVNPVWQAQVLSHLKLTRLRLGYLINFNAPLIKDGIKRFIL
jgi:GxxExxY protein